MTWHIDGSTARLAAERLTGKIDLEHPAGGLADLAINGIAVPGRLCSVTLIDARNDATKASRWDIEDAYIRGDDLVAVYRPQKDMPFRWQVYWRMSPPGKGVLAVLDVVLSVQTPLLETWPMFEVCSQFDASDVDLLDRNAQIVSSTSLNASAVLESVHDFRVVFARSDGRWSYAEMVHPSDFDRCRVTPNANDGVQTEWRVGASFMEKGVIRRIQVRTAVLPADVDAGVACAQLEQLIERPPPLTA